MKKAAVALPLLMASLAFASKAGENFGQSMAPVAANAAIEQWIKMIPLFLLAFGIAVFFSLIRKSPEKAVIGCGGFTCSQD